MVGSIIQRVEGSPDLYRWQGRSTSASINFMTCHDGFTLMDLVSYNGKHNEANGEENRDGSNDNLSWNCGWEGPIEDLGINLLRSKQIKNALVVLMISQGIPMILSGDEMGNTQFGNNNAYCQDNEISWLDWSLLESNQDLFRFFKRMIACEIESISEIPTMWEAAVRTFPGMAAGPGRWTIRKSPGASLVSCAGDMPSQERARTTRSTWP
jgi:glycogen operon protein